jgi:hypothetical protein
METNEVRLTNNVRQRIDAGELPPERPPKISAGFGNGEACSACDQKIDPAQLMYQVESSERAYRLHTGCHGLWTGELMRRALFETG